MDRQPLCFVVPQGYVEPDDIFAPCWLTYRVVSTLAHAGWPVILLADVSSEALANLRVNLPQVVSYNPEEFLNGLSRDEDIPAWAFDNDRYHRSYRLGLALQRLAQQTPLAGIEFLDDRGAGYVALKWRKLVGPPLNGLPMWVRLEHPALLWDTLTDCLNFTPSAQQNYAMERYALSLADAWLCPTAAVARQMADFYRLECPTCILPPRLPFYPTTSVPSTNPRRILYYALLDETHGVDIFVQAALMLLAQNSEPLEFDLIGPDTPTSRRFDTYQQELVRLIPPALQPYFHFYGPVKASQLAEWVNRCTLTVAPARIETLALAARQLAQFNRPLILSDIPALADKFKLNRSDIYYFDGSVTGLTQVIQSLLTLPPGDCPADSCFPLPEETTIVAAYQSLTALVPPADFPLPPPDTPLVSVIVPHYNMPDYLDECIASVQASTYQNWELLLVDYGSTEVEALAKLAELEQQFQTDPRSRIIRGQAGHYSGARNIGINQSRGRYILSLDNDDLITPDYLNYMVRALEKNPTLDCVTCYVGLFKDGSPPTEVSGYVIAYDLHPDLLAIENRVELVLTLFRREVFNQVSYKETMFAFEDWELAWQLVESGLTHEVLPKVLYRYRQRSDSVVRSGFRHRVYLMSQMVELHPAMIQARLGSILKTYIATLDDLIIKNEEWHNYSTWLLEEKNSLYRQVEAEQSRIHSLTEQIATYEHRLQSQDLMTRHWVRLTISNLGNIFLYPQRSWGKLKNWYRFRLKSGRQD